MKAISVAGIGAVSPAGWDTAALGRAVAAGQSLPTQACAGPGRAQPFLVRRVPQPCPYRDLLTHPRLRRADTLSLLAVAAALEAIGPDRAAVQSGGIRLGLVFCTLAGGLAYTRRFYHEAWQNPATASPLLFPETVFNATAGHIAAVLGAPGLNYTLVGGMGIVVQALATAATWLLAGEADACLVVAAEELDWLAADGHRLFSRSVVAAEGAGALYLKPASDEPTTPLLAGIDLPCLPAANGRGPSLAPANLRWENTPVLVCDGQVGAPILDAAVQQAWSGWPGPRVSPMMVLGHALTAGTAWQCVAAVSAIQNGRAPRAWVGSVQDQGQVGGVAFAAPASFRACAGRLAPTGFSELQTPITDTGTHERRDRT